MSLSLRQFAVSGGTAALLLGGAAAVTVAAPSPASAATQTVTVNAVTAPVQLPDGRTVRITGMGGYGHQATPEHVATVAAYKTDANPGSTQGITNGLNDSNPQSPYTTGQVPAGYNQQISTQSGGGAVAVGVVAILALSIVVFFKVKHGHIKATDAVLVGLLGISLAGTVIGTMGNQITNSLIGSLGGVLGGL
jgi:hypothetical protein